MIGSWKICKSKEIIVCISHYEIMAYYNACRYTIRLFFVLLFCFLYRAFAGKQVWSDVNGMYVDAEENIRKTENGTPMYGGDAFPFSSITKGGKLVFKMGRRPAPGCYGQ